MKITTYAILTFKCHYFSNECMGLEKTILLLFKYVTFSLVSVWVKVNRLSVTKSTVVFKASLVNFVALINTNL